MSNQDNVVRIPVKRSSDDANDTGKSLLPVKVKKYSVDQSMSGMNSNTDECPSSSVDEEEWKSCFDFDQLPIEVFEMIFFQFDWKERLRYRLVCKSWHERITRTATVPLKIKYKGCHSLDETKTVEHLAQCNFKFLDVTFISDYIITEYLSRDFPLPLWETIGPKICVLSFVGCHLGDLVMKAILLNCDNLQHLRVTRLKNEIPAESFCSLSMLKSLEKVASKNLKKFEIGLPTIYAMCDPKTWTGILEAFFRLFPTLSDLACGNITHGRLFSLAFGREINENEELTLATIVARSLYGTIRDSMSAINNLATLSLKKVDLCLYGRHFTKEVEVTFVNFFGSQEKLEDVRFTVDQPVNSEVDLKAIFSKIVQSCPDQCQLHFCPEASRFSWLLKECVSTSKLQKISIGRIEVTPNSLRIKEYASQANVMSMISKYAHITHLSIEIWMSDEILQSIFQHMTNLKKLKMLWARKNGAFALTGRPNNVTENTPIGYSINCLKNLERLEIESEHFRRILNSMPHECSFDELARTNIKLSNNVYREFRFPKLQHFSCIPPEDPALLVNFGIEMPLLKKIKFFDSHTISLKALIDLCRSTKNLHTIFVDQSQFKLEEARAIFEVCPSLQLVHSGYYEYFYEPFTKQVREHRIPNRYV